MAPPTQSPQVTDQYDHEICMVDNTANAPSEQPFSPSDPGSAKLPRESSEGSIHKRFTKGFLKEELARRKYARFQEDKYAEEDDTESFSKDQEHKKSEPKDGKKSFDSRRGRLRERFHLGHKKATKAKKQEEFVIDILYENQRGWFFCGIPLYSSKSLLNFDPSPWTTVDFKDSPVNITNAQVPDPTWHWAWKSWYVDMSHDVDEEGWEYSLAFRQGWSWHGTHPWFHSFVRRRRWLRKRVKTHSSTHGHVGNAMVEAHQLNQDYFTIHSARRERSYSPIGTTPARSSFFSGGTFSIESDSENEDITSIATLMKTLDKTTIDRKKLDAVKNFIDHGDDELYYLPEVIKDILGMFMYQNSRRELLTFLEEAFTASDKENDRPAEGDKEYPEHKRRNGIHKAKEVVTSHVRDLDYWSDVKAVEDVLSRAQSPTDPEKAMDKGKGQERSQDIRIKGTNDEVSRIEIKGIPRSAGLDEEPGILRPSSFDNERSGLGGSSSKQKELTEN